VLVGALRTRAALRCLAAFAAYATVAACTSSSAPRASTPPPPDRVHRLAQPIGLAAVRGTVWAVSAQDGTIAPLSPRGRATKVGPTPLRAAFDGRLLWVSVFGAGRVLGVDPGSGRVVRRVALPGQPEGLTAVNGRIWVVRQAAGRLSEIRPDGSRGRSVPVGQEPRLVAAGRRGLYVADFGGDSLFRVDPTTGTARRRTTPCRGPQDLAVTPAAVWVACTPSDVVLALDPGTLSPLGRVRVRGEPDAVRIVGGRVWVACTAGPSLVELDGDPTNPQVLQRRALGRAPALVDQANVDLAVVGGMFYVSSPATNRVITGRL
jgi:outer membrane protein assembly factor BamB